MAGRCNSTPGLTSLTFIATTKKGLYRYQPNNCQMMVLQASTIVFYVHLLMNQFAFLFFTLQMMIPAIQKPIGTMCVSIQSNIQFGYVFVVLHTWTTV
jgi:hypothetical protein